MKCVNLIIFFFFSFFYSFQPLTNPKRSFFYRFLFIYFEKQHVQFIRVTGPAFQCNTAIRSFCPLFALLCLCNFPPRWPPRFSPLSPVARLPLTGQPLGWAVVDLRCGGTHLGEPTGLVKTLNPVSWLWQRLRLQASFSEALKKIDLTCA